MHTILLYYTILYKRPITVWFKCSLVYATTITRLFDISSMRGLVSCVHVGVILYFCCLVQLLFGKFCAHARDRYM